MSITLHQIKVFNQVAECMSVSKAAQRLHMTQPAVSNIIKQLQIHFDCQLTEVIGRKIYLTAFGEKFLETCHNVQKIMDEAHTELNLMKGGVSGELKVACVSTAKYFLPNLLGRFKSKNPDVKIKLNVSNRQGIISRLQENMDDLTIMSHPPKSIPVETVTFYDDELIVVSSPKHRFQSSRLVQLSDLKDEVWVTRESGSGTSFAADQIFQKQKFSPNFQMEISDCEAIKQAIMADIGISVVSKQSVSLEMKYKLLQEVQIKGFPFKHPWYFVHSQGKKVSPLTDNFLNFAKLENKHT
tara:strand:+ start:9304 stop:10197 length:894 start_codon:yes stop_codon:yes gene_type:complete